MKENKIKREKAKSKTPSKEKEKISKHLNGSEPEEIKKEIF